jgi:hypothetical protein
VKTREPSASGLTPIVHRRQNWSVENAHCHHRSENLARELRADARRALQPRRRGLRIRFIELLDGHNCVSSARRHVHLHLVLGGHRAITSGRSAQETHSQAGQGQAGQGKDLRSLACRRRRHGHDPDTSTLDASPVAIGHHVDRRPLDTHAHHGCPLATGHHVDRRPLDAHVHHAGLSVRRNPSGAERR